MTPTDISTILTTGMTTFGGQALIVLTALVAIGIAFYVFRWGWSVIRRMIAGETVTRWSWLDKKLYKPYKGYNRWHSRQWNVEHTMN